MLDFRITTFLQLCETRSYTKTAKILGMTQPSVTQHIKYLQKQFGCLLFTYEGKMLRLTPEGEYLRRQAEIMDKMSKRIAADLERMSSQKTCLRFGFPTELGEEWGASLLTAMMAHDPTLRVQLVMGYSTDLLQRVETGELDFVLTDKLCAVPALQSSTFGKVHFGCYTAASAELPGQTKLLLQSCLLLRTEQSCDRLAAEQLLAKKNLSSEDFASVWTANSAAVLRQMVRAGRGVWFAYETAVPTGDAAIVPLPLGELSEERTLVFLHRKEATEQADFRQFFDQFKQEWNAAT